MAFIYKITNIINNKVYIGKTEKQNPEERLQEHFSDYSRRPFEKRPLYDAIKKYGKENFTFAVIEETDNPEEREIFYIKKYNSYVGYNNSNGYNATLGGEGKNQVDREAIIDAYIKETNKTINRIAKDFNVDAGTVSKILKENDIDIRRSKLYLSQIILQIDRKNNNIIMEHESLNAAAEYCGHKRKSQHIREVCLGIRKSAYGFKWAYKNNNSK